MAKHNGLLKGFTLVELLIAIAIIGLLASTMMLSGPSSTVNAQAATIISDLRNLKAAAIMHYMDSMDVYAEDIDLVPTISHLAPYLDSSSRINSNFGITTDGPKKKWLVTYKVSEPALRERLAAKAESLGLLGSSVSLKTYEKGDPKVYMIAR